MTCATCQTAANEKLEAIAEPGFSNEPLVAFADEVRVAKCGSCPTDGGGPPRFVRFERYEHGAIAVLKEYALPNPLVRTFADRTKHNCLPWVRVQRDPDRFRSCMVEARRLGSMDDSDKVYRLLKEHMVAQDQEVFVVLLLDTHMQVRGVSEIARGARDAVQVPVPDTLRIVLVDGATVFVIAHNHPTGNTDPSPADVELTKHIQRAGKEVGVELMDHLIFGDRGYYSFREHGKLH